MKHGQLQRTGQRHCVAGGADTASAALMYRIRLGARSRRRPVVCWRLGCLFRLVVTVALPFRMWADMVFHPGRRDRHFSLYASVSWSAKDHRCRSVALEGHCEHRDQKNEPANPEHMENSKSSRVSVNLCVYPVRCATLRFVKRHARCSYWPGMQQESHRGAMTRPSWAACAPPPVRPPLVHPSCPA